LAREAQYTTSSERACVGLLNGVVKDLRNVGVSSENLNPVSELGLRVSLGQAFQRVQNPSIDHQLGAQSVFR